MTRRKRRKRRPPRRGVVRRITGFAVAAALVVLVAGGVVLVVWERTVLDLPGLHDRDTVRTLIVPTPTGERTLVVGPANPFWTTLDAVSDELVRAVVTAEDARFWSHSGFDWGEVRSSVRRNLESGRIARGASTITMQLAKNLFLWRDRSFLRKGLEVYLAWRLEQELPKRRILELYLNVVEWGPGVYGIGEASRHYFRKSPAHLTLEESALLAAILPAPVDWSPDRNPALARDRKRQLLERLR